MSPKSVEKPRRRMALLLEWDGTAYAGWQWQANAISLQAVLQKALSKVCAEPIQVTGCSRTDAGVHARGHVSHFETGCQIPVEKLPVALNALLPDDVAVRAAEEVPLDFHARFQAIEKQYSYYIHRGPTRSALLGRYSYRESRALDLEAMREASAVLVGTHDFRCFMAAGGQVKTTVRSLYRVQVEERGDLLRFIVRGNGFLYNMVRIIAGTLLYVGLGKLTVANVEEILASGNRCLAGKTLPARGLFLDEVVYDPPRFAQWKGESHGAVLESM